MNKPAQNDISRVNGISVATVFATIDAIMDSESVAAAQFRVRNVWLDGGHTRSIAKDYYAGGCEQTSRSTPLVSDTDLPAAFKGGDRAPSPLEQLLIALSACVTTTLVTQAAIRGVHIDSLEVQAAGDIDLRGFLGMDEQRRRGFSEIRLDVQLLADTSPVDLDDIVRLGIGNSPVFSTVSCGTQIVVTRDGSQVWLDPE
jgi:uncharacterized OsmC-like protein